MTQTIDVLVHLRKHGKITPLVALKTLGVYRLGGRIFDLRKAGHLIHTERAKGKSPYAIYRLLKEARRG